MKQCSIPAPSIPHVEMTGTEVIVLQLGAVCVGQHSISRTAATQ